MARGKPSQVSNEATQEKAASKRITKDALELVRLRNHFYRDNYRRLIVVLLLLIIVLIVMSFWVSYLLSHRPAPTYFATNVQGGLTQLVPLNSPSVSTAELVNWATRAAIASFTFNYVQYRDQLQTTASTYFTPQGAQQYYDALNSTNDLQAVIGGQYIVTAEPTAAPQIIWQGVIPVGTYKDKYGWQVTLPLKLTIQNPSNLTSRNINVTLTIVRTSYFVDNNAINLDATKGIGIGQLLAKGENIGTVS